jgi:hypothetical protein
MTLPHDHFVHGDFPEICIPLVILLFNRAKALVFGRIRRVFPGVGGQNRFESGFGQSFMNDERSQVFGGNVL